MGRSSAAVAADDDIAVVVESQVQRQTSEQPCRFCGTELAVEMVDLGMHPLCESFLTKDQKAHPETFYPLVVRVCSNCLLAQVSDSVPPENIFDDYAYFSSYSTGWLEHAARYVWMMIDRFDLDPSSSRIMEIASNDGYLLQYFVEKGYEVLGIEPAETVRAAAEAKGIPSIAAFFNESFASTLGSERRADVVVANNVLAHTPDINGFVAGIPLVMSPEGVATFEFPHVMRLLEGNQFDTIYHEHFSYFSLHTARRVMVAHDLEIFDVEEIPTHGGSLRVFVKHAADRSKAVSESVGRLLGVEAAFGLLDVGTYERFAARAFDTKRRLLRELIEAKGRGESIVIYGAAGKGNTLLNYCGIGTGFIEYACDRNPYKHGRYTPGTRIPIYPPSRIAETRPDLILILPWNLEDEIVSQLSYVSDWGGRFLVPIPDPHIVTPKTA